MRGGVLDVAELMVISAALGVPATALLFPEGQPAEELETFTGERSARTMLDQIRAFICVEGTHIYPVKGKALSFEEAQRRWGSLVPDGFSSRSAAHSSSDPD